MTEDELRSRLRDLRDEPVPADSLARVRLRVADRTATAATRSWHWKTLAAVLAMAAVVIAVWVSAPSKQPQIRPTERVARVAPAVVGDEKQFTAPQTPTAAPHKAVKKLKKRPVWKKPDNPDGVLVRIETPDPDVVILLVGE